MYNAVQRTKLESDIMYNVGDTRENVSFIIIFILFMFLFSFFSRRLFSSDQLNLSVCTYRTTLTSTDDDLRPKQTYPFNHHRPILLRYLYMYIYYYIFIYLQIEGGFFLREFLCQFIYLFLEILSLLFFTIHHY